MGGAWFPLEEPVRDSTISLCYTPVPSHARFSKFIVRKLGLASVIERGIVAVVCACLFHSRYLAFQEKEN